MRYLSDKQCRRRIDTIRNVLSDNAGVTAGLRRLAFGNCSDAVYLVFADEMPPAETIKKLDLFNISEIKRVKGGGVEIKFFDRQKALEKLFEFENTLTGRADASSLIKALTLSEDPCDAEDTYNFAAEGDDDP